MNFIFSILVLTTSGLLPQTDGGDLLQAVNAERGGRHWIDQQPDPPRSPEESQQCFQIEDGSQIELVAAEPLVVDPVWIDFDDSGRMLVAEYRDYPIGPVDQQGNPLTDAAPLSRIVMLQDTDNDGQMDQRTVFADELPFCHSFLPLMGGVLAGAQTQILFLQDTDGDQVADVREVWFDGFEPAHPQMQIGCPVRGADGWIYLTYAPGNISCRRPGFETTEPVRLPRQDMRFHPLTMQFEAVSGLGQFGNTVDRFGRRFFCTNRNPIMMEMIPQSAVGTNPYVNVSGLHTDVGPSGGDTKVFPQVAMKSNYLSHAGTHTSACGVTAYVGNLWDQEFQNSVFVCEPVGHLITRSIIQPLPHSPALTAVRARPNADFLASSDTWFRPASLRTGPDSALYVADMYRMWVEHPKFLPPEIAARIDWRAGEDKGRIWRIVPADPQPRSATESAADADIRKLLAAPNSADVLIQGMHSPVAESRRLAVQLAASQVESNSELQTAILQLAGDSSAAVRHEVALACCEFESPDLTAALQQLVSLPMDTWLRKSVLLAAKDSTAALILALTDQSETAASAEQRQLIHDLAAVAGQRGNIDELASVLNAAAACTASRLPVQTAVLTGLASGLPRSQATPPIKTVNALLQNPPPAAAAAVAVLRKSLDSAAAWAIDADLATEDRVAAIRLLSSQAPQALVQSLPLLLRAAQPVAIQQAAIQAAAQIRQPEVAATLLDHWNSLGPGIRSQALALLLGRSETTTQLLQVMAAGTIAASAVDIDQRVRLLQHRDEQIRQLATQVFGEVVSANRKAVADRYLPAISMSASAERGAAVFEKTCSKCHRIDGRGHNVGPDISDTRNRSRDALLYDILDPNRRVDPQFSEYVAITHDGLTVSGLLVSDTDTAIVLRQPEGREPTILRSDLEELLATSKSLMPEGIEQDISVAEMADLLEYLKDR